MNFDLDTIFKIALGIIALGIGFKVIKGVAGLAFKVALIFVVIVVLYRLFM